MALLSVEEALARILDGAVATGPVPLRLEDAAHRTLAEDLRATLTQPPFNASAMDGYAVRHADIARLPATLPLLGESRAGQSFGGKLTSGGCVRIFTGAPVPEGADAIVIQENTTADGPNVTVVEGTPDPAHIRSGRSSGRSPSTRSSASPPIRTQRSPKGSPQRRAPTYSSRPAAPPLATMTSSRRP